jgi:hypothetical protein
VPPDSAAKWSRQPIALSPFYSPAPAFGQDTET